MNGKGTEQTFFTIPYLGTRPSFKFKGFFLIYILFQRFGLANAADALDLAVGWEDNQWRPGSLVTFVLTLFSLSFITLTIVSLQSLLVGERKP